MENDFGILVPTVGNYHHTVISCSTIIVIHKDIFACLFSIHNTVSLSCHEQVCLSGLRFERYFSHHRASRNVAHLNILVHDMINLLYYYCYFHNFHYYSIIILIITISTVITIIITSISKITTKITFISTLLLHHYFILFTIIKILLS